MRTPGLVLLIVTLLAGCQAPPTTLPPVAPNVGPEYENQRQELLRDREAARKETAAFEASKKGDPKAAEEKEKRIEPREGDSDSKPPAKGR